MCESGWGLERGVEAFAPVPERGSPGRGHEGGRRYPRTPEEPGYEFLHRVVRAPHRGRTLSIDVKSLSTPNISCAARSSSSLPTNSSFAT
jgi:hypothetical protein